MQLADEFSYANAMHVLCDRTLRAISVGAYDSSPTFPTILGTVAGIEDIYLKTDTSNIRLTSIGRRCEICALKLHVSFVIAWLCRPALRQREVSESRTEVQLQLAEKCHTYLLECVRAFVGLHSLSILASRSWAVLHNGLSSALLLGLLGATRTNPEVRELQSEILDIFKLDPDSEKSHGDDKDGNIELSRPHTRIISALRKLYDEGQAASISSLPRIAETDTPRQEIPEDLRQSNWQDWQGSTVAR